MLKLLGTVIDELIAPISPKWANKRTAARANRAVIKGAVAHFESGKVDRTNRDWRPSQASADAAMFPSLPTIIARSRHIANNTPHGRSILHAFKRNTVGCGILPRAAAKDRKQELRIPFNEEIERLFYTWADDPELCDIEGRQTFWQMQRQVAAQKAEAGEFFVHFVHTPTEEGLPALKLQRLEVDHLDTWSTTNKETGNEIRRGIEVDKNCRPVAYWFFDRPLNDISLPTSMTSRRIPADKILHIYEQERPGQTHGAPVCTYGVMNKVRDIHECDATELYAQRVAAALAFIVQQNNPDLDCNLLPPPDEDSEDGHGNEQQFVTPGLIFRGKPGETVQGMSSNRPSTTYEAFIDAQLRAVGAGSNLSYEQVTRDFTKGVYSSNRQSMLEDRRAFEPEQELLISHLCIPVWREFVRMAFLTPGVELTTAKLSEYVAAPRTFWGSEWSPPGWPWIDPEKEQNAHSEGLRTGTTTLKEICASKGLHYLDVLKQIAREREEMEKLGVGDLVDAHAAKPGEKPPADDESKQLKKPATRNGRLNGALV